MPVAHLALLSGSHFKSAKTAANSGCFAFQVILDLYEAVLFGGFKCI